jgi:hypothetical protein
MGVLVAPRDARQPAPMAGRQSPECGNATLI